MKKPNEIKIMKTVSEMICPHCSKKIMVSIKSSLPMTDWILKKEDIQDAKEKLKAEIGKMNFNEKEKKEQMIAFVDNPDNMFGPSDVENMKNQIIGMNESTKK